MTRPVVYVAGPIAAPNAWMRELNIRRAEELALDVWRLGAAAICPHTSCRNYEGALDYKDWIEGDLELLRRADAVLLVPGWEHSRGANMERDEASRLGKPTFVSLVDLETWMRAQPKNPKALRELRVPTDQHEAQSAGRDALRLAGVQIGLALDQLRFAFLCSCHAGIPDHERQGLALETEQLQGIREVLDGIRGDFVGEKRTKRKRRKA